MATVPAGWFSVGCYRLLASSDAENAAYSSEVFRSRDDERIFNCVVSEPPRRVWVSSFEIDRYEVTREDYQQCLDARVCERRPPPDWEKIYGARDVPAIATYEDAERFCRWRDKRMPTNAEWEKAARGTDDRIYPWGDTPPTCKHLDDGDSWRDGFAMGRDGCEPGPRLHARHRYPAGASPYGVEDTIDNAREWVSDWYGKSAEPKSKRLKIYVNEQPDGDGLHFLYAKNAAGLHPIVEYNWNSIAWLWNDHAIVDPQGPPEPDGPGVYKHAIKGTVFGIPGVRDSGEERDDTHREYAGFRCARSVPGPPPPSIPQPAPETLMLPFREAGYTPPGTSSDDAPASAPSKHRTETKRTTTAPMEARKRA